MRLSLIPYGMTCAGAQRADRGGMGLVQQSRAHREGLRKSFQITNLSVKRRVAR